VNEDPHEGLSPEIRHCRLLPARQRDACWLELMAVAAFMAGLNYSVINAKWDGIRAAFFDFDVDRVAAMTPDEIEAVKTDPRVIHNNRKIEAVVSNARAMVDIRHESGGFAEWLDTMPDVEAQVKALHRRFMFMGPSTAYYFLRYAGEPVECMREPAQAHRGPRRH
jgi:3-methyladenine DNA glycosylase Tag